MKNATGGKIETPAAFQVKHLFWATAMAAASLTLFGAWGLLAAAIISYAWYYVYFATETTRLLRLRDAIGFVIVFALAGLCCVAPLNGEGRGAARRMMCAHNLKQIGLAFWNYESDYGCFPPAVVSGGDGRPWHSWRVLLLPYLEQADVYEQYSMDEPWDGPNNSKLLTSIPNVYQCPEAQGTSFTTYCVVVGPNAAFAGVTARKAKDFREARSTPPLVSISTTLAVVEVGNSQIPWLAPRDISPQAYLDHVADWGHKHPPSHSLKDQFTQIYQGENSLVVDGSICFVPVGVDRDILRESLNIADGAPDNLDLGGAPIRRTMLSGYISFFAFIGVAGLPLFWLRAGIRNAPA